MAKRTFQETLPPVAIEVPGGRIKITPIGANEAFVEAEDFTVRGVSIRGSLNFICEQGFWRDYFTARNVPRSFTAMKSGRMFETATQAQSRTLQDAMLMAVCRLAETSPEIFQEAARRQVSNVILRMEDEIASKERELAHLRGELQALLDQEAALDPDAEIGRRLG